MRKILVPTDFYQAADMLCLIRREKGFYSRLFHPSKTIKEVFQCTVPLLVLHDEEPKD